MFQSKTANVINILVDTMLRKEKIVDAEKKVMFITLCLEVAKSSADENVLRRYVHLMYSAPARYVLVGSQVSDKPLILDHHEWQYCAHHDSCWRYDGTERVLWDEYLSMCKELDSNIAPAALYTSAEINSIQFREVKSVLAGRNEPIRLEF